MAGYAKALAAGELSQAALDKLTARMTPHLELSAVAPQLLGKSPAGLPLPRALTRLRLSLATGPATWEGLVVGFPGNRQQLSTEFVGTPFLRRLLYPVLDLQERLRQHTGKRLPCLYILGARFSEVHRRKLAFLDEVVPHLIVLTRDLASITPSAKQRPKRIYSEFHTHSSLCAAMQKRGGLRILGSRPKSRLHYLADEVPTAESSKRTERLDILARDNRDNSLVAFEIKGPHAKRVEVENLFLQGLEHRNWLEDNKMALKFLLEGPKGRGINTRKRVGLALGFYDKKVPPLFRELRDRAVRKDRLLSIDFVRLQNRTGGKVEPRLLL